MKVTIDAQDWSALGVVPPQRATFSFRTLHPVLDAESGKITSNAHWNAKLTEGTGQSDIPVVANGNALIVSSTVAGFAEVWVAGYPDADISLVSLVTGFAVSPGSLEPLPAPPDAWWAALSALQTQVDQIDGGTGGPGDKGPTGDKGPVGDKGSIGDPGVQGIPGVQGAPGDKGPTGDAGVKGANGDKGAMGDTGSQGPVGDAGTKGPSGDAGATGSQGATGDKGSTGDKGPTGDQGPAGNAGVVNAADVQDSTTLGRALMKAASVGTAQQAIGIYTITAGGPTAGIPTGSLIVEALA